GRLYTRNGQLQLNANNEIVTTTGQRVLGYGVDDNFQLRESTPEPLSIPLGQERVAQATENAFFTGVLNPAVAEANQPEVLESSVLGDGAVEAPDATDFTLADISETTLPLGGGAVAAGAGTGPGDSGSPDTVRYRWAYVDGNSQESSFSTEFTTTGDGTEVTISGLPDAGGIWTDRVLYRTEAGGSDFYRVGLMGATGDYTDASLDAAIISNPELDADVLEAGSYSYYVTFYDSDAGLELETRPTARIGPKSVTEATGGRLRLDLSEIPPPTGAPSSRFDQMRVYRSNDDGTGYFLAGC
ncbi:hypothetical protein N9N28_13080, partial [Rubripirellula amarantea]|nr:hypothetical protein [Rubripirellula amarantea]